MRRWRRVALAAAITFIAALTLAPGSPAQLLLPGRHPLLLDVVTITLHSCLGYLAVVVGRRVAERRATEPDRTHR